MIYVLQFAVYDQPMNPPETDAALAAALLIHKSKIEGLRMSLESLADFLRKVHPNGAAVPDLGRIQQQVEQRVLQDLLEVTETANPALAAKLQALVDGDLS